MAFSAKTFPAMDTVNTIVLPHEDSEGILTRAMARVFALCSLFDPFAEDSEIARINAAAGNAPVPVSAETAALLKVGITAERETGGAFSILLGAVTRLWKIGYGTGHVPDLSEIRRVLPLTDSSLLSVRGTAAGQREAYLEKKGAGIDPGGIAKGFIADEAAAFLLAGGENRFFLDFGGTIVCRGMEVPVRTGGGTVYCKDEISSTSGVSERYFTEAGERYHHLIDPLTGTPAGQPYRSVTLRAPVSAGVTAAELDAWSTACFVRGGDAFRETLTRRGITIETQE